VATWHPATLQAGPERPSDSLPGNELRLAFYVLHPPLELDGQSGVHVRVIVPIQAV
jgi:hypothetical protein